MKMSATCMNCLYAQQYERAKAHPDEQKKMEFLLEVMRLIEEGTRVERTAPVIYAQLHAAFDRVFETHTTYAEEKKRYNQLIMVQEEAIRERIRQAEDPLEAALCISRAANYIDFTVGSQVDVNLLEELLAQAQEHPLDPVEYANLCRDLASARSLVYLTDNCGEVVLDKLAVEQLQVRYPSLRLTVLMRGYEAINDATLEDARECGLSDVAVCVGNGSNATGTPLTEITDEARSLLFSADVLISKGQGNFETLSDTGLNIYYLFLCKCERFMNLFHVSRNTGMLVNGRRLPQA